MNRHRGWIWGIFLVAVIGIVFAEPLLDGDVFFHLAYAQQMLDRGTPRLDHTLYSWTPASNRTIYCAWLSELWFLALFKAFGIAGFFALRYAVVMAGAALLLHHARRSGWKLTRPEPWAIVLLAVLAARIGSLIKPELISLLLLNAMVFVYFTWRRSATGRCIYLAPVILLIWVNAHGAFVLIAPFLLATAAGEALNRHAPRAKMVRLLAAFALCGVAILLNPYGGRYPWQLIQDYLLGATARPDAVINDAHQSIWSNSGVQLHLPEFFGVMTALAVIASRKDWAVRLANLVYLPLFAFYVLRTTFFWPVVVAYSFLEQPRVQRRWVTALAAIWFAFAGARAGYEAYIRPMANSWLGFGIGYLNPVPEAEFLASHDLPDRFYNSANSGSYLLWRLYPRYRVMADARSFPYLNWFTDQFGFTTGTGFEAFLAKYPARVAVADLAQPGVWRNFLKAPGWRLIYYGPTSAIFVRQELADRTPEPPPTPERFDGVRNAEVALRVFDFAVTVADYRVAWKVLDHVERDLVWQANADDLRAARDNLAGQLALRNRSYEQAIQYFDTAFRHKKAGERDLAIQTLLLAIQRCRLTGAEAQIPQFAEALRRLQSND